MQGIIAARLDALSAAEKALLQDAAVVGKVFWLGAWQRSAASTAGRRRRLCTRSSARSSCSGRGARPSRARREYAFRHLLVRDVAYGQIPRAARADKHRRAADWIEALGRPDDQAEMLAHHYSSALEYARAAGREDAELDKRARLALREAGDRAWPLAAWPAAARFYGEAHELWPSDDPGRPQLRFRLGRAREAFAAGTGLDLMESAVTELEAAGEIETAADAAIVVAVVLWTHGEVERHDAYVQRALQLVGDRPDSPARVAAIATQAARLAFDGHYDQLIEARERRTSGG